MRIKAVVYGYYSKSLTTVTYVALLLLLLPLLGYLRVAAALADHRPRTRVTTGGCHPGQSQTKGFYCSNQLALLLFGIFLQQRIRRKVPVFHIQVLDLSVFFSVS